MGPIENSPITKPNVTNALKTIDVSKEQDIKTKELLLKCLPKTKDDLKGSEYGEWILKPSEQSGIAEGIIQAVKNNKDLPDHEIVLKFLKNPSGDKQIALILDKAKAMDRKVENFNKATVIIFPKNGDLQMIRNMSVGPSSLQIVQNKSNGMYMAVLFDKKNHTVMTAILNKEGSMKLLQDESINVGTEEGFVKNTKEAINKYNQKTVNQGAFESFSSVHDHFKKNGLVPHSETNIKQYEYVDPQ
jgi:hypothetical protein